MRLVVASDWHADWVTQGVRRYEEVERAVWKAVGEAIRVRADAFIFAGDLVDPDDVPAVLRAICLGVDVKVSLKHERIANVFIPGNHDVVEDGSGLTTLSPLGSFELGWVFERPSVQFNDSFTLVALPYVASSHPYDPEYFLEQNLPALQIRHGERGLPTIVVGHLSIPGVQPGEETKEMPRGREVLFPLEAVAKIPGRKVAINGHYHRQQVFRAPQGYDIHIPGSLARLTFGEERHEPGFLVIEV